MKEEKKRRAREGEVREILVNTNSVWDEQSVAHHYVCQRPIQTYTSKKEVRRRVRRRKRQRRSDSTRHEHLLMWFLSHRIKTLLKGNVELVC